MTNDQVAFTINKVAKLSHQTTYNLTKIWEVKVNRFEQYKQHIEERFSRILSEERDAIETAARKIANSLKDENHLLHVFGTGGHSMMAAEEIFHRAGGFVQIDPIFFASLSVTNNVLKSRVERIPGVSKVAMRSHTFLPGEVMLIVSHVGVNSMTIDAALEAKEHGLYVVGIESTEICNMLPAGHPARHPSNKNLNELVDVTIDAKIPYGDAVIEVPNAMQKIAPISSNLIFFILHILEIRITEIMIEDGYEPLIWRSGNIDGGDEHNDKYHELYKQKVKAL